MAQTYYPLAKSPILTPQQWSKMAQNWLGTGVIKGQLNELAVYADSTGMQVKIKSGQAYIKGHFFESDVEEVLPISAADVANPRIDRIIVRIDWVADTMQLAVLQGVPAVSPVGPALTKNDARWEIPLAYIYVNSGAATIAAGNVYDERIFTNLTYAVTMSQKGILSFPFQQSFQLQLGTGNLSTPAAADTLLPFNAAANGNHQNGDFVNGVYTAPEDGVYLFGISAAIAPPNGCNVELKLFKGSSMVHWLNRFQNDTGNTFTFVSNGISIQQLSKGDTIKFYAFTSAGASVDKANTWASIAKIA
jgi:hypothetical protein